MARPLRGIVQTIKEKRTFFETMAIKPEGRGGEIDNQVRLHACKGLNGLAISGGTFFAAFLILEAWIRHLFYIGENVGQDGKEQCPLLFNFSYKLNVESP